MHPNAPRPWTPREVLRVESKGEVARPRRIEAGRFENGAHDANINLPVQVADIVIRLSFMPFGPGRSRREADQGPRRDAAPEEKQERKRGQRGSQERGAGKRVREGNARRERG